MDSWRGRRVTVMGLGAFGGGFGAVAYLAKAGARVTVTDLRTEQELAAELDQLKAFDIERFRLGGHDAEDFRNTDLLVVNPAVKPGHPLVEAATRAGVPTTSEMRLFWERCPAPIVGVTGSNGKSTTTNLIYHILRQTGRRCWLGGNIGKSLLPQVNEIAPDDLVVLELSSFQLHDLDRGGFSPHVAVVTNVRPNHLDWHGSLEHYRHSKQAILRWQQSNDLAVLSADDPDVRSWTTTGRTWNFGETDAGTPGAYLDGSELLVRTSAGTERWPVGDWLGLPGRHNLVNAAGAVAAAVALGADRSHVESGSRTYEPLPHRLQDVGEVGGVRFVNDSLATTPDAAVAALRAFDAPLVVLAGGYDKQVSLSEFAGVLARRAKAVVLMGQTAELLRDQILAASPHPPTLIGPAGGFREAFDAARAAAAPGDVVLLSPGCASYGWFRNFAERGEAFLARVEEARASESRSAGRP